MVNTVQYTDDVLWNCISETYTILLTNVTPITLIKKKKRYSYSKKEAMWYKAKLSFETKLPYEVKRTEGKKSLPIGILILYMMTLHV